MAKSKRERVKGDLLMKWGLKLLTWAARRATGQKITLHGFALSYTTEDEPTTMRRHHTGIEPGFALAVNRVRDHMLRMPHKVHVIEHESEAAVLGAPGAGRWRTRHDLKSGALEWVPEGVEKKGRRRR